MKTQRMEGIKKAESLIIPASQVSPLLKMCVYGRNKIGKTRFACSSDLPTLLIDCNEQGWKVARKFPNVDVFPLEYWEQVDWVYWFLKGSNHKYKKGVVVIDTITMLANIGMKWVLGDEVSREMGRDPLMPDKRAWGKLGEVLKNTIINFRNLDMHVIFTAQEKITTTEEEDTGNTVTEVHPEISPAPRSVLLSAVDIIGRIYTSEVEGEGGRKIQERRMLLGTHPKYVSGNRFDELKRVERNPTLGGFIAKVSGGSNGGS